MYSCNSQMLEPHIRIKAKEPLVVHATHHMDAVHDLTYMHYAVPRIEVDGTPAPPGQNSQKVEHAAQRTPISSSARKLSSCHPSPPPTPPASAACVPHAAHRAARLRRHRRALQVRRLVARGGGRHERAHDVRDPAVRCLATHTSARALHAARRTPHVERTSCCC